MSIEKTRRKGANNVAADFERLMNWRRLMNRPRDRFEILRVERERIKIAVPTDGIERMMREGDARESWAVLHQNIDILLFIDRHQFGRCMQIALGIRRAHLNLSFVIQVALRNSHRPN